MRRRTVAREGVLTRSRGERLFPLLIFRAVGIEPLLPDFQELIE